MKKNELISMVDRILDLEKIEIGKSVEFSSHIKYDYVKWYAEFLNTPLNISQFVPAIKVRDKWEVLEMPNMFKDFEHRSTWYDETRSDWVEECEQYQTAKEQCLFEGEFTRNHIESFAYHISRDRTIEYLVPFDITLTKKGLEVSGLNR